MKEQEDSKKIYETLDELLTILENNFRYSYGRKIPMKDVFEMVKDINVLTINFEKNIKECGKLVIKRFIPLLDLLIKIDTDANHFPEYENNC